MNVMDAAAALWDAWSNGQLSVQICAGCHGTQHPPGPVCSHCFGTDLAIQPIDGTARLLSWSTVHRAPSAEFEGTTPYAVAIVLLSGGALMQARVAPDVSTGDWEPGLTVELQLGRIAGRMIPVVVWSGPGSPD